MNILNNSKVKNNLPEQVQYLLDHKQYAKALPILQQLLITSPGNPILLQNLATTYRMLKAFDKAIDTYYKCALNPVNRYYLAYSKYMNQEFHNALIILHELEKTTDKNSEIYKASMNILALIYLQIKDFKTAKYYWNYRWEMLAQNPKNYNIEKWDGQNLTNKSILIVCDQGIGDEVMYASLFHNILEQAKNTAIECNHRLVPAFQRSFPSSNIYPYKKDNNFDGQFSYMIYASELLFHFEIQPQNKYLVLDENLTNHFKNKYDKLSKGKKKIGIAWFSNDPETGYMRNINIDKLLPILNQDNFYVSLQYNIDANTINKINSEYNINIFYDRTVNPIKTLDHFLHQISSLDHVITIANSTAHFAGALGCNCSVLTPKIPSWRWFLDDKKSSWYENVKIFKQEDWNNWSKVITRLC